MPYYESKWIEDYPNQCKSQFYCSYVYDIFVMFGKKDHDEKFTREEEKGDKVSFLDISIIRIIMD